MLNLIVTLFIKRNVRSAMTVVSTKTITTLLELVIFQALLSVFLILIVFHQYKSNQIAIRTAYEDMQNSSIIKVDDEKNRDIVRRYVDIQHRVELIIKHNSNLSDPILIKEIADLEIASAKVTKIPLAVGLALSVKESHFVPKSVSYNGSSFGIKMINLHAHKNLHVTVAKLFEPTYNIPVGYKILDEYSKENNGLYKGLMHYYGSTTQDDNVKYAQDVISKSKSIQKRLEDVKNG